MRIRLTIVVAVIISLVLPCEYMAIAAPDTLLRCEWRSSLVPGEIEVTTDSFKGLLEIQIIDGQIDETQIDYVQFSGAVDQEESQEIENDLTIDDLEESMAITPYLVHWK